MDIKISGFDGENVIAQIIEDLLTVNGLTVKRNGENYATPNLTVDQLDAQLSSLKKNKVVCNISVVKVEEPKLKLNPARADNAKIDFANLFLGLPAASHSRPGRRGYSRGSLYDQASRQALYGNGVVQPVEPVAAAREIVNGAPTTAPNLRDWFVDAA